MRIVCNRVFGKYDRVKKNIMNIKKIIFKLKLYFNLVTQLITRTLWVVYSYLINFKTKTWEVFCNKLA